MMKYKPYPSLNATKSNHAKFPSYGKTSNPNSTKKNNCKNDFKTISKVIHPPLLLFFTSPP